MDVRDIYPDLKVYANTYDDNTIIKLRFDPPNEKDRTPIIRFRIPRIDHSWPYDEFAPYDFSDEVWISIEQPGQTYAVTLDGLKQAFDLIIQEVERAYENRDDSIGWTFSAAGD